jgi:hypothetical protein
VVVEVVLLLLLVLVAVFALEPHAARLTATPVPIIAARTFMSLILSPTVNAVIRFSGVRSRLVDGPEPAPDAGYRQRASRAASRQHRPTFVAP